VAAMPSRPGMAMALTIAAGRNASTASSSAWHFLAGVIYSVTAFPHRTEGPGLAMTHDEAFLQDIIEHPDDDAPRLIYADWLDDHGQSARGEFIRVQCELARLPEGDERRAVLAGRETDLLEAHESEWTARLAGWGVERPEFRRGLVESVKMTVRNFLKHAGELMAWAPVRAVELRHIHDQLQRLADSHHLTRLTSLILGDEGILAQGAAILAGSPHLAGLRELLLWGNGLRDEGTASLASSPYLANLTDLDLSMNDVGDRGLAALARSRRLKRLAALYLWDNLASGLGIQALAESRNAARLSVLYLGSGFLGDLGALALASSPHLGRLTELGLSNSRVGVDGVRELARSATLKRLRKLDLRENPLGDEGAQALASSHYLKDLVTLKVADCQIGPDGAAALRARFGDAVVL
jgi:uncharacterized protein (TIGR02996 family)